jgi:excinuclease ABC subunit A
VVVIEHNLEVVKTADWIIDLGPEGGEKGGEIVVQGPPETVAEHDTSYTAEHLRVILEDSSRAGAIL